MLVTFAVEPEFAPWKKSRSFVAASVAGFNVYKAMMGSAEVDVVVTGMGPINARKAMEAVSSDSYAFCVSSGFAGALKREHGVGEVLVPAAVRRLEDGQEIECDATLVRKAVRVNGAKKVESFLSAGKIADSAEEKSRLGLSGDAIEMENFAVLSVAAERNIRAIAVRAISDRFDEEMPVDFSESIGARGQILRGKLALEIASDPLKIPALIRLGRQSKLAAAHLVEFLESYIELLSAPHAEETPAAAEKTAHSAAK